jgi:GAF domain-containing protein
LEEETFTPVEWKLPLVDEATSEPQSMEEEVKRLQTLQSYFVLDSEGEDDFDRITRLAAKMFDVPTCVVSLVDLGRQWFLSKVGLDEAVTELPRKLAFCSHTILSIYRMMIIPDATKDDRFKDNPLVTGGLNVRFYAGAALISPEGYKLGTLCLVSPVVRPGACLQFSRKCYTKWLAWS